MGGGEQDDVVSSFLGVTGATDAQARFFLESANWELDAALISFFEASDDGMSGGGLPAVARTEREEDDDEEMSFPSAPVPAQAQDQGLGQVPDGWPARSTGAGVTQGQGRFPGSGQPKGKEKKKGSSSGRGGITTLSDLGRQAESDEDSDEGPQEYYTGGEKSGMMVQDPSKRGPRDVDAMFDRVRRFGAQEGRAEPPQPPSSSNRSGAFAGSSRTLSGEPRQSEQPAPTASPARPGARAPPEPVFHTITFWRNGFTVDDGPLRRLDDPANEPFLDSINKGECPKELEPADRSTQVHVNLVKKEEEWEAPPQPKYVAFGGTGRTLGSSAPAPVSESLAASAASGLEAANQPIQGLVVDESKPSTSIQLRLSDGTRMVARFNHTHTIADIRGFIDAARPGNVGPYSLQAMGFPPKPLTDMKQSVEAASLFNAVVIQKAL
ncbi:plant UBX domain-containing protein 4 [Physcomitrium patens]|uniref:NSFL1 cofactor p47 n=1 Tax=Physcomitrium patens TaxID=3218 RepID=A0A2K1K1L9_PHYPA|nr:plant UBX domain-containing protein 4-like [Physcomitrium patens]PNR47675.1 hypothetical protein PHYPA_012148 [Physcomitrium patens]|eukprot:XP_024385512.1 plant UBX domain-containing protein 4-like [Physcomitrella patens]